MLKNPAATTETTKRGQKDFAATLGPLDLIIIKGKSIDILKIYIKRCCKDLITWLHHQWDFLKGITMMSAVRPTWKSGVLSKGVAVDSQKDCQ